MEASELLIDMLKGMREDLQANTKAVNDMRERMIGLENNINGISSRIMRVEEWKKIAEKELEQLKGVTSVVQEVKKRTFQAIGLGVFGLIVGFLQATGAVKLPFIGQTGSALEKKPMTQNEPEPSGKTTVRADSRR